MRVAVALLCLALAGCGAGSRTADVVAGTAATPTAVPGLSPAASPGPAGAARATLSPTPSTVPRASASSTPGGSGPMPSSYADGTSISGNGSGALASPTGAAVPSAAVPSGAVASAAVASAGAAPHFATPQAAMRYLAAAWNRNDTPSLKHVTDPSARFELQAMHREATNLRLDHCSYTASRGDYQCFFDHDYPVGYPAKSPHGTAEFTVGPARRPGWYMTVFISCG